MIRQAFIEQIKRLVYGGIPNDDHNITDNLINIWVNQGIGLAVKQNYKEAIQIDGVGYVTNGFYTTFKGIVPAKDEKFIWKITLPQIPIGLGTNEGVTGLRFKDGDNNVGINCTPMSQNQVAYYRSMRPIPNTVLYYPEGIYLYAISTVNLSDYTALVTMVSGGDSSDLTSVLNVPDDYLPTITKYVSEQLMAARQVPADVFNDGSDVARTT